MEQIFLISRDCVCCTWIVSVGLAGCPGHHCSLSAGSVWWSLRQNGGSWPSRINSESRRGRWVGSRQEMTVQGGLIFRELLEDSFFLVFSCYSGRFPQQTLYFVALRMLPRISLIFQRSLPAPLSSPKKCPFAPWTKKNKTKHTHAHTHAIRILPFNSSSEWKPSRNPAILLNPAALPLHVWRTAVCAAASWTNRMKEFICSIYLDKKKRKEKGLVACSTDAERCVKDQEHHRMEINGKRGIHHQGEQQKTSNLWEMNGSKQITGVGLKHPVEMCLFFSLFTVAFYQKSKKHKQWTEKTSN